MGMYSVSFIGSFRKEDHYKIVKEATRLFRKNGIIVNSPKGTEVCDSIDDFVIFESDDKGLQPAEIQRITLEKIISSDAVFVCDLGGYVGKTTCYEIGCCLSKDVPLYFLEKPVDLPIFVLEDQILSVNQFLKKSLQNKGRREKNNRVIIENKVFKTYDELLDKDKENKQKRVVVCGSMLFYNEMIACQKKLLALGVDAIIPKDEDFLPNNISEEEFRNFKKKVSSAYLKKIREKETGAILVYNAPKNGKQNYIGANTFVEIAMAFVWNRKIYLYNDIYEQYEDELMAWECICLNGNMSRLADEWNCSQKGGYQQLSFDLDLLMKGEV